MNRRASGPVRFGPLLLLLVAFVVAPGCASFNHDWNVAASYPIAPGDLAGRWEGTWKSDDSGHNDRLRCLISKNSDGVYSARFHANYKKVLNFGYTVPLKVTASDGVYQFSGKANLGWVAGGVYRYEGHADETNFFSTYRCKYDHGTFQLGRPPQASATHAPPTSSISSPFAGSTQLLVVTTADWSSVPGTMRRFERANPHSPWVLLQTPNPVVVGRNGLGWGEGLNPPASTTGPIKREGDGKSPAGVFLLSSAFGAAEPAAIKNLKLPYLPLTEFIECVDDAMSRYYNSIVDRGMVVAIDWNSSEKMRAVGARYRLGVVVDHNVNPRIPAHGSCIFLHIWQDARTGTSGCTAMEDRQIESLVGWLDPSAHPVLVQLPEMEYVRLQSSWALPKL